MMPTANAVFHGLGGVIVCTRKEQAEQLAFIQKSVGAIMSPFECWLVLRGVKSLAVRMEKHDENGRAVAAFLDGHKKVKAVFYPGLRKHPQHELAKRQMDGFGGMISIYLKGGLPAARAFMERTELFACAESLGGVESLIEVPLAMTHGSVKGTKLAPPAGLVRLSVGIETVSDLIADLAQAIG